MRSLHARLCLPAVRGVSNWQICLSGLFSNRSLCSEPALAHSLTLCSLSSSFKSSLWVAVFPRCPQALPWLDSPRFQLRQPPACAVSPHGHREVSKAGELHHICHSDHHHAVMSRCGGSIECPDGAGRHSKSWQEPCRSILWPRWESWWGGGLVGDTLRQPQLQQQQQLQQLNQIVPSVSTVSCWGNKSMNMPKYTQKG